MLKENTWKPSLIGASHTCARRTTVCGGKISSENANICHQPSRMMILWMWMTHLNRESTCPLPQVRHHQNHYLSKRRSFTLRCIINRQLMRVPPLSSNMDLAVSAARGLCSDHTCNPPYHLCVACPARRHIRRTHSRQPISLHPHMISCSMRNPPSSYPRHCPASQPCPQETQAE